MLALLFFNGGGGELPDEEHRSRRSNRLQRILDAELTLKGVNSRSSIGRTVVEVRNVEQYTPVTNGTLWLKSLATKTIVNKCWVSVSVVIDIHQQLTWTETNVIPWLLSYSRVRVNGVKTKSGTGSVDVCSSGYVYLTPSAEVTSYGHVEIQIEEQETQSPTPREIVQVLAAIRNLRKKP